MGLPMYKESALDLLLGTTASRKGLSKFPSYFQSSYTYYTNYKHKLLCTFRLVVLHQKDIFQKCKSLEPVSCYRGRVLKFLSTDSDIP